MAAHDKAIFGPDGIRNLTCHLKMENVYSADDTRQWLYEIWGTARDMRLQEARTIELESFEQYGNFSNEINFFVRTFGQKQIMKKLSEKPTEVRAWVLMKGDSRC